MPTPTGISSTAALGSPSASSIATPTGISSSSGVGTPVQISVFTDPEVHTAIFIAGELRQHLVRSQDGDGKGITRNMRLGGGSKATCRFTLTNKNGYYKPQQHDEVVIWRRTESGTMAKWFAGLVDKLSEFDYSGTSGLNEITVDCVDYGALLSRVVVGREVQLYLGNEPYLIALEIANRFFGQVGVTFSFWQPRTVPAGALGDQIFNWMTGTEVMNHIASESGGDWRVDFDKNLYLFGASYGYAAAPFSLTQNDGNWRRLTVDTDYSRYRNRIYVKTSQSNRAMWTDTFTVAAGEFLWLTMAPLSAKPVVTVDGSPARVVDFEQIGTQPYDFYWLGTSLISNPASFPAAGTVLEVSYPSPLSYVERVQDDDEIAAHGLFEGIEEVSDLPNRDAMLAYGQQILARRLNKPRTVHFETDRDGLEAGMRLVVNLTRPEVSGTFLITDVASSEVGKGIFFRHQVTAVDCASQLNDQQSFQQQMITQARQPRDRITLHAVFQLAETIPGLENPGLQLDEDSGQRAVLKSPGKGVGISCSIYFRNADATSVDCIVDVLKNGVSIFPSGDENKMVWPAGSTEDTPPKLNYTFTEDPLEIAATDIWTIEVLQADPNAKDGTLDLSMLVS